MGRRLLQGSTHACGAESCGNSYTLDEIRHALSEAGFTRARLLHPDTRMDGLVEAFRPD